MSDPEDRDPSEDKATMEDVFAWVKNEFGWTNDSAPFAPDDWTLIVKLHAMIETGLNGAIFRDLNRPFPALADAIAKMDTNGKAGKVAFAKALGIITSDAGVFIQHLSELRNKCVHNIKEFNFDLVKFLETEKKGNEFIKAFNRMVDPKKHSTAPQGKLLIGTVAIMALLMLHDENCKNRDLKVAHDRLLLEQFLRQQESTPTE